MVERGGACESLPLSPLPLLIASHGEAGEAGRGVRRGINCTHSPHASRLLRPKGVPNHRRETCGWLWAAENPRLGPGVGVAGPRPVATSRRARGLAGFLAKGCHVVRRRQVAGPRPGARAGRLPPSDSEKFRRDGAPNRSRLPAAGSSR